MTVAGLDEELSAAGLGPRSAYNSTFWSLAHKYTLVHNIHQQKKQQQQ